MGIQLPVVNISQADLAQRLFISPQAVGKWERGESIPDIITFNRLAEILGVDLNYFSDNFPSTAAEPQLQQPEKKLAWDMSNGNWVDADFSGLKNLHAQFSSSNMQGSKFIASDIAGITLKNNRIDNCDFSGADISNSHMQNSHLSNNSFVESYLKDAEFSGCHMKQCDFSGANLTGAVIKGCDFQKIVLVNAMLVRTVFNGTHLRDTVFEGTVADCHFENCGFSKVTFQHSKLINTFFKGDNFKHLKFEDCQADRLTYEFLKSGRADVSGITLIA